MKSINYEHSSNLLIVYTICAAGCWAPAMHFKSLNLIVLYFPSSVMLQVLIMKK